MPTQVSSVTVSVSPPNDTELVSPLWKALNTIPRHKRSQACDIIGRILENIVAHPDDPKFRSLNRDGNVFQKLVSALPAAEPLLVEFYGFRQVAGRLVYDPDEVYEATMVSRMLSAIALCNRHRLNASTHLPDRPSPASRPNSLVKKSPRAPSSFAEEYLERKGITVASFSDLERIATDNEYIARQALDFTNAFRREQGLLMTVTWDDSIATISAEHAKQMAEGLAPFNHDNFDKRIAMIRIPFISAGENLAMNGGLSEVARAAVDGWIASPGHRKNLLGSWTRCGIGCARSSRTGNYYLTQIFICE